MNMNTGNENEISILHRVLWKKLKIVSGVWFSNFVFKTM